MIRSGSVVLTRDSLKGQTATLAAGTTFTRALSLPANKVGDSITVELLVDSPAGEPVFMDASRSIPANASITDLRVANVKIRVPAASLSSGTPETVPVGDLPEFLTSKSIGGGLQMTVTNPFAVTGNLDVVFTPTGGAPITKSATLAAVTTPQSLSISLDSAEMRRILDSEPDPTLSISGTVAAPAPITVTPKQIISMSNRVILKVRMQKSEEEDGN
jgi:hypothetical protein